MNTKETLMKTPAERIEHWKELATFTFEASDFDATERSTTMAIARESFGQVLTSFETDINPGTALGALVALDAVAFQIGVLVVEENGQGDYLQLLLWISALIDALTPTVEGVPA